MRLFITCVASIVGLAGFSNAEATSIVPTSYVYYVAPGDTTVAYQDNAGQNKLTDGLTGTTDPNDGSWAGFIGNSAQGGAGLILFNFATDVTITDVEVNFLRVGNIGVPVALSVIPGAEQNNPTIFSPSNLPADNTEGFIDFTGSWTGNQLILGLGLDNQTVPFINEVRFNPSQSEVAPEPGTIGLGLLGLAAAIGWGRKRNRAIG